MPKINNNLIAQNSPKTPADLPNEGFGPSSGFSNCVSGLDDLKVFQNGLSGLFRPEKSLFKL